jgi:pheromone shutdown protein TraB
MLAEIVKKPTRVLVIGTDHAIQRHQDTNAELEALRAEFEKLLRQLIKEREIDLIAEEAGDDTEVWKPLKQEEEALGKLAEAFGGGKIADAPVPTIAKQIADERPKELRHVDIRAPNAEKLSITERDAAMAAKVREVVGDADSIVVIVGEDHRAGMVQRLKGEGMDVECLHFP